MTNENSFNYRMAVQDFHRARQQAAMRQLMSRLTGKSADLLSYDVVEDGLQVLGTEEHGVIEIELDKIVGSVGRYRDFTRDFLPKHDSNVERWARVKAAIMDMRGMPPIEVYQVGEVYFVKDGNHRVSVARQLETETISAYVTEVKTRVPLTADDDPNEAICKARYAEFLQKTNLDMLRPDANLLLTFCNQFPWFMQQIEAHRRKLGDVYMATAVADWYDHIYLPVIKLVREQGILHNFRRRTEADIFLLVSEHRAELEEALGWEIGAETAVSDLAEQEQDRKRSVFQRIGGKIRDLLTPEELEEGPEPGRWRKRQLAAGRSDRLFTDYLVAIRGTEADWHTLDHLIPMAKWEDDRLLGLHVVSRKSELNSPRVQALGEEFEQRCHDAGLVGEFAVEVGDVADTIIKRAAWADLVVTSIAHPPGSQPLERLGHGFNRLVQRCPRPLLAVPTGSIREYGRHLLSYDGSPKADEALYIATYFKIRWDTTLVVLTVETENTSPATLDKARRYIEQFGIVDVIYELKQKPISEAVLATAAAHSVNEIIMGGFGYRPVKHLVLGSTVEYILREFNQPILICR